MSNAVAGVGTRFRRWSGTAWADLAEINSIAGPTMKREFIDVTSLDSTGGYREFIAAFRDAGTVTLSMNFTRSSYQLMKDDFEDPDAQNYEIILPDDEHTSFEFKALVTELPLSIKPDDKITAEVVMKITGEPLMNSGANSGLSS